MSTPSYTVGYPNLYRDTTILDYGDHLVGADFRPAGEIIWAGYNPNHLTSGYNPNVTITIEGLDPALWAWLTRLESKLDRLIALLEEHKEH